MQICGRQTPLVFVFMKMCVLTFISEGYFPCVWIIIWQLFSYRLSKHAIPLPSVGLCIASFNEMYPFPWILSFVAVSLQLSPNLCAAQKQFYYDKHWRGVSVFNVFMIVLNRNYTNWNTTENKAQKTKEQSIQGQLNK